jgi:hypothetical protein
MILLPWYDSARRLVRVSNHPVGPLETADCHQGGFGGVQKSGTSMWSVDPQNPDILKADNCHALEARTVDLPLISTTRKQLLQTYLIFYHLSNNHQTTRI